ncbi:MAG: hypothetical protein U0271_46130 [Polyangiaceae bacterium]
MTFSSAATGLHVTHVGQVSAVAWLAPAQVGLELNVIGKLALDLGLEGHLSLANPEPPGWNLRTPAPLEIEPASARKIIVRGWRPQPGKLILRRGTNTLAEVAFGPGDEPQIVSLANTMQTTIAGRRGDEWLVVEGVDHPGSRRWCKLPKLGIVAMWNDVERMLLTSRVCLVDVASWSVVFVMRASRKVLPAMAPTQLSVMLQDLGQSPGAQEPSSARVSSVPHSVPQSTPSAAPPSPPPTPAPSPPPPPKPAPPAFAVEDSTTAMRLPDSAVELIDEPSDANQARTRMISFDEAQQLLTVEPAPQSVTRAFSADERARALKGVAPDTLDETHDGPQVTRMVSPEERARMLAGVPADVLAPPSSTPPSSMPTQPMQRPPANTARTSAGGFRFGGGMAQTGANPSAPPPAPHPSPSPVPSPRGARVTAGFGGGIRSFGPNDPHRDARPAADPVAQTGVRSTQPAKPPASSNPPGAEDDEADIDRAFGALESPAGGRK